MPQASKHFGRSLFSAGGIVLLLIVVVLVNLILSRVNARWDLTADRVYSLSEGTRNILSNLEEEVLIKVFYSKDVVGLPVSIKNYASRLLDFIEEYELYSDGKVEVSVYNPEPDSEEEEWALKYGVTGIDLPTGDRIYFGLVALAADQEETIPVLDPAAEQRLEYDLTRVISRVQSAKRTRMAVISGFPVFGGAPTAMAPSRSAAPWLFIDELKKTYDVEQISPFSTPETIDDEINLLLLVHPKDMSEALTYAVDQYVLAGGNAIVLVDPHAVMDMTPGMVKSSSLESLFAAWGIRMDAARAVVDFGNSTRLRAENNRIEDNPLWLSLGSAAFNTDDPITSKLDSMLLPVSGAIEAIPESGVAYTPLLRSSPNSAPTEAFKARFGVSELRREFSPTPEEYDLAVKLQGSFTSAFPNGRPAPETETAEDGIENPTPPSESHMSESRAPATLVVVADADFLFDGYYVNRQNFLGFEIANIFNDNLNFLLNASEMLSGVDDLIAIRSRGTYERPFERVRELEATAQSRWLVREQELVRRAEETNRKLQALEQQKGASQELLLSEEQEAEIRRFQEEKIRINRELKTVRRNLRADIERLGNRIKFLNIFMVPALVSIGGLLFGLYRRRKSTTGSRI